MHFLRMRAYWPSDPHRKKAKNGSGFTPKKMAGVLGQNGFDGP